MSSPHTIYNNKKDGFVSRKPLILCNYLKKKENRDPNFKSIYNNNFIKKISYRVNSKNKKILKNSNSINLNLRQNGRKIKSLKLKHKSKKNSSIKNNKDSNKNFLKRINKFFSKNDLKKKN